jgi:hypothetical protein
MICTLTLMLLCPLQNDAALVKEVETWSDAQLSGNYYLERARAGIAIIKDKLRGPFPAEARNQVREMESTVKELEEIFARHDPKKPDATALRLVQSTNERVATEGGKALRRGDFPEAMAELKKSNPVLARDVEKEQRQWATQSPLKPAEAVRTALIDLLKRTLGEMKQTPQARTGEQYFRASTTAYFGSDMKAWETWLTQNEAFLGVLPQFRQSVTGDGILYVDEEAKTAGVPWAEWQTMTADARAEKLKGKNVREDWKRIQVSLELRRGSPIALSSGFQPLSGSEMDVTSLQLPYWLLWHKRHVDQKAPGWGVRVLITGSDADLAKKVVARCEKLGIPAKTGADPKR